MQNSFPCFCSTQKPTNCGDCVVAWTLLVSSRTFESANGTCKATRDDSWSGWSSAHRLGSPAAARTTLDAAPQSEGYSRRARRAPLRANDDETSTCREFPQTGVTP